MVWRKAVITLLAMTLLASVHAVGRTLTCSTKVPSYTTGCFFEYTAFTLGNFELAIGVDAEVRPQVRGDTFSVAGYTVLAWYDDTWSAWAEVFTPKVTRIPMIGSPDWLRVGFTITF